MKTMTDIVGDKVNSLEESNFCRDFSGNPLMVRATEKFGSPFYLLRIDSGTLQSKACDEVENFNTFIPSFRDWIENHIA